MTLRYKRKAQEKYWNLIQIIDAKHEEAGIDTIEVSYSDFSNNPAIADSKTGVILLERLGREGGIKIIKRPPYPYPNTHDNYFKINILSKFGKILEEEYKKYQEMAQEYQKSIKKEVKTKRKSPLKQSKYIQSIIIVEPRFPDEKDYLAVINHDYENAQKAKSAYWRKLIEVIRGEKDISFEKEMADYFNYNQKCKIYFQGKYKLTNILEETKKFFRVNPDIETGIISENAYKRRLGKS